jgi:hypothetical protein
MVSLTGNHRVEQIAKGVGILDRAVRPPSRSTGARQSTSWSGIDLHRSSLLLAPYTTQRIALAAMWPSPRSLRPRPAALVLTAPTAKPVLIALALIVAYIIVVALLALGVDTRLTAGSID